MLDEFGLVSLFPCSIPSQTKPLSASDEVAVCCTCTGRPPIASALRSLLDDTFTSPHIFSITFCRFEIAWEGSGDGSDLDQKVPRTLTMNSVLCDIVLALLLFLCMSPALGLHVHPPSRHVLLAETSRRNVLSSCLTGLIAATSTTAACPSPASSATAPATAIDRDVLLDAISRKATDDEVIGIIAQLQDPSLAARFPDRLEGAWELIWSYKAEAFSPLLRLPPPFRPTSYQYLGSAAAPEVGDGRIAQGLTGGVLLQQNQLWLSSGATPYPSDPSIVEIKPPFRLELGGRVGSGIPKRVLVESGSDADFRQVNGRTSEAQAAGPNQYQQLYVEGSGPGSLRISSVIAGDPVIVGEIFVHRKL